MQRETENNTSAVPEDSPAPSDSTSSPSSAANAASSPESASSSQMPPVAQNYILSLPEFFWCKKETTRLDVIKSVMDNADPQQTIRFNAMVNNFDSRCAQNHYRSGDLEIVERELAQERDSIAAEAKSEWVGESRVLPSSTNVTIPAGVMQSMLLRRTTPIYPPIAKAARVSGTVVLQATISKSGLIENLRVVSGPPLLYQAALDAVSTWQYKPYQLDNEPAEVETTVNVVFTLGG
jgi:TonB family protein